MPGADVTSSGFAWPVSSRAAARAISSFLLVTLFAGLIGWRAYVAAIDPAGLSGADNHQYFWAATRLAAGQPLYVHPMRLAYDDRQYPYAPLIALAFRALLPLGPDAAFRAWAAISTACVAGALAMFLSSSRRLLARAATLGPTFLVLAFAFWPTRMELSIGNVDALVLLLLAAMYVADARGRWRAFAVLVAAAAVVKVWTFGAVFYLLVRRRWRDAALSVACLVAALASLFTIVGWREFAPFCGEVRTYAHQPLLVSHSIDGMARLFFARNPQHVEPWVDSVPARVRFDVVGYAVLVAGVAYVWLRSRATPGSQAARLEIGFTICSLLLGVNVSHMYYAVLLLPLIWTLLTPPVEGGGRPRRRVDAGGAFVVLCGFAALVTPPPGGDSLTTPLARGWLSIRNATSFGVAAALWIATLCCLAARYRRDDPPEARDGRSPAIRQRPPRADTRDA